MKLLLVGLHFLIIFLAMITPSGAQNQLRSKYTATISQEIIQDWLVSSDPWAMPIFPDQSDFIKQNPPIFRWPHSSGTTGYVLRLKGPTNQVKEFQTKNNWVFLPSLLAPGDYQWQVRKANSSEWSDWRTFNMGQSTYSFLVPESKTLFERASQSPRPRSFTKGQERTQLVSELLSGSRKKGFSTILKRVEEFSHKTISQDEFLHLDNLARSQVTEPVREANYQVLTAAYAWIVTGKSEYLNASKTRALALAQLDAYGGTGRENADEISREIALTLAITYDLLYPELSENNKNQLREAIINRTQDLVEYYLLNTQHGLRMSPFSSHGVLHAGAISVISTLLAGDAIEAKQWFLDTFPIYAAIAPPWGGDDGGYANGTNYAGWDFLALIKDWDILARTIGVDFTKTAWSQEFGRFLAFFLPPGTPKGLFGDGEEYYRPHIWKLAGTIYTQRVGTKAIQHYDQLWSYDPYWDLSYLFGPLNPGETTSSMTGSDGNLLNSAVFPSIGWAAFHSDLRNPNRTSVYFKSSPYGSFNHSHADQNSFVINSQGRPLAIASGYYDSYWSAHHENWTIQTRAHNAITVDGGTGQKAKVMEAKGKILEFQEKNKYGYVIGEATQAYDGFLTKAIRTVMYIKPDYVLIYDLLESKLPRQWEWNIHSENQFIQENGEVRTVNAPASLCIKSLSSGSLDFHQTNQFLSNPTGDHAQSPNQWHGTYQTNTPTKKQEFLFLLKVNCVNAKVNQVKKLPEDGYSFQIGNRSATVSPSGASLMDKDIIPPTSPQGLRLE